MYVILRLLRQPICLGPGGLLAGDLQLSASIIIKTAGAAGSGENLGKIASPESLRLI